MKQSSPRSETNFTCKPYSEHVLVPLFDLSKLMDSMTSMKISFFRYLISGRRQVIAPVA
jgi:hypothetical protein